MSEPKVQEIHLDGPSDTTFFLIHGYTGSPTDFNELPRYLHDTHGVRVRVMLLPGHGTRVQDLDHIQYQDFLDHIEPALQAELSAGRKVILGGISFGAMVALILAGRYPVQGVITVCAPYRLKFPFNVPGIGVLGYYKKYWRKRVLPEEHKLREKAFRYADMHVNGLRIMRHARRDIKRYLLGVVCPVLFIQSRNDPLGRHKGVHELAARLPTPCDVLLFDNPNHNIFFSEVRFDVYKKIEEFFSLTSSVTEAQMDSVAAIVPAYNEAARIGPVLETLTQTAILDEIIVVDDGSKDNTADIARTFANVTVLSNHKNSGKAYSVQRGVDHTQAGILFLCDADLWGLTPPIVEAIVRPVQERKYGMFIGLLNNPMQKAVKLFALNSGQRALRRELWAALPYQFKYRYRLEAGLNFIAKAHGSYGWQRFDYYQTVKERKYGVWKGTLLRWWMNLDVSWAYVLTLANAFTRKAVRGRVSESPEA